MWLVVKSTTLINNQFIASYLIVTEQPLLFYSPCNTYNFASQKCTVYLVNYPVNTLVLVISVLCSLIVVHR